MTTRQLVKIGILSPATPDRPHFKSFGNILPSGVSVVHQGLGLLGESYQDLASKENLIVEGARQLVNENRVNGLMLTGGFVTLLNPGIEEKVATAIALPMVSAISSAISALTAFEVKSVLLMTPFDRASDQAIKAHIDNFGFELSLGPSFDNRIPGSSLGLSPDELFKLVEDTFTTNPAQAIYFQGATMDPLPIIQRIEDRLGIPVITSNTAMLWNVLSKQNLKYSVPGYGRLLAEWPHRVNERR